jgi:hypothetical protein
MPVVVCPGDDSELDFNVDNPFLDEINSLYDRDRLFEALEVLEKWLIEDPESPKLFPIY